jgi:hypothetical protein
MRRGAAVSYFLETGAHGFTVEFAETKAGQGTLTVRFDSSVGLNKEFDLAQRSPSVAAEMLLEGIEAGGLSYLQFSTIAGLLIKLCRVRASVPSPSDIREKVGRL